MTGDGRHPLPSGWAWSTLGEVCHVIQGQSPPGDTYNTEGTGLPFLQGKAEFGALYPQPIKWCSAPSKVAEPGDVLISIRAPVGPTNLCPGKACIGRGLAALRPFGDIPAKYILYTMRATEGELLSKSTGTTFDAVRGDDLRSHEVPIAPLPEQRRIVAEIEKHFTRLDAAVASLQRARANLKRYRASVLKAACEGRLVPTEAELARREGRAYEPASILLERILRERRARWEAQPGRRGMYREPQPPDTSNLPPLPEGWVWANGDALFEFVTSGSRGWAKFYAAEGVLFLRVGNLDHYSISLDLGEVQRVRPPHNEEGVRTRVRPGDVLISITADVGMVALAPDDIEEAYINQHVCLARPARGHCNAYLAWFLASDFAKGQLRLMDRGATKMGLGLDDIRAVKVALPPLAEQQRIVAEVERHLSVIEAAENVVEANLKRAQRLRQAILKRAFEGKLAPQDPSDEPASALLERIRAKRGEQGGNQPRKNTARRRHVSVSPGAREEALL